MTALFQKFADNTNPNSLAAKMRMERLGLLNSLLSEAQVSGRPLRLLDLGGDPLYWKFLLDRIEAPIEIVLLNLVDYPDPGDARLKSIIGDGRDLSQFADNSFDLVHSNSLIEHVGTFDDQRRMAEETRRVGKRYFVQTPNRYFPLEPHFLLPFFQFYPTALRVYLARKYKPGWYRTRKVEAAIEDARHIRLLNRNDLSRLFPDGNIWEERLYWMTKSFVVYRNQ